MKEQLSEIAVAAYEAKEVELTPDIMRMIESQIHHAADHRSSLGRSSLHHGRAQGRYRLGAATGKKIPAWSTKRKPTRSSKISRAILRTKRSRPCSPCASRSSPNPHRSRLRLAPVPAVSNRYPRANSCRKPRLPHAWIRSPAERLLGPAPQMHADHVHTNRDEIAAKSVTANGDSKVGRNDLCPCGSGKKVQAAATETERRPSAVA